MFVVFWINHITSYWSKPKLSMYGKKFIICQYFCWYTHKHGLINLKKKKQWYVFNRQIGIFIRSKVRQMENSFISNSSQNNFYQINNSNVLSKMIQSALPMSVISGTPQTNPFSQNSMLSLQPLLKTFHPVMGEFCKKAIQDDPKPNYSYIGK